MEAAFPVQSPRHTAFKIAFIYASISVIWILFSDQLLSIFVKDIETITRIQTVKGWFFVLATSYLIFLLLQKEIKKYCQVEEALRHSKEQLLSLMDALPIALSWADEQGNIQYSNNKFRELFGYTLEDMPTVEQWFQLAYPDQEYRQTVVSNWQIAVENAQNRGPEIAPIEVTITCKDGSTRYVAVVGTLLHDRILVVFNDLTESKRAEKALVESENRYRTLFDSANDAIIIIQDNMFIECNQKTLEMFGCTREQIIGQTPYKFSPLHQPDGRDSTEKALEKIATALDGEPDVFEWRHIRLNGEAFDAEVSFSLIEIESEKFIQAIVRDISDRKRLDKELRLMQRWVEQSVDFFFWVGEDSQILYVNQAVRHSLGYTKEEFRTMKVSDFDLDITLEVWPDFTQKLREHGSHCFETRLRKKNGQVFPVEITANILNFEGKDHFFAYGGDISAKVSAEVKRKELENQLRQAQKMESIGTLAGGIAHDFNNILSPIILYTEMVLEDISEKDPLRFNLEEVLRASLRAKDLVKQILTFSHQAEQEKIPLKINSIIKEVLKLLRSSLPSTIEIRQNIEVKDSVVLADPTQIHQILMNLCTNAAHSMREKGGVLEVSLVDVDLHPDDTDHTIDLEPGQYIKLTVSDTGRGIEPAIMDRIFDPYFTTQEKGKGTGLGLSVVHGIVNTHGGHISAYSEPDKGTRFDVYLPLFDLADIKAETVFPEKLATGDEHILLVDDEEILLKVVQQTLERLGYQVTVCTSSIEALEVFRESMDKFNLVITDLTMPIMTGDKLAGELMNIRPDIPIILCTGFSERMTRKRAEALGIKGFLMKPIVKNDLTKTVREVLDKSQKK